MRAERFAVIGGGGTGLAAADLLARSGRRVVLYEAEPETGGLVASDVVGGERLERIYRHIFTSDEEVVRFAEDLGLGEALSWRKPSNAIWSEGRIRPFTTPWDLLRYDPLSLRDRIRLGLLVLKARRVPDWRALEGMTAREWVIREAGDRVWERVWRLLMESKFDDDAAEVSAVWIQYKLALRGHTRSKGMASELLGYLDGTFLRILDALAARIRSVGGEIRTAEPVRRIRPVADGVEVETDGGTERFGGVLFTPAPPLLAGLAPDLPGGYRERLEGVLYKANLCLRMELSERVSDYYWTTVADPEIPFVAAVEHTNLIEPDRYGGGRILYLTRYLDPSKPLWSASDEAVREAFHRGLGRLFPGFRPSRVRSDVLTRSRWSQPVVPRNYSSRILPLEAPWPGLYLSTMAQIYPEDRGLNYALRAGRTAAEEIGRIDP